MASNSPLDSLTAIVRAIRHLAAVGLCLATGPYAKADELEPVDVAIVLLTDVSRSIDDGEFTLEKRGYVSAFTPQVMAAIEAGPNGRVAVSYIEFAGSEQTKTVVGWTIISDEASAQAFEASLIAAPRSFYGRTAIGSGIDEAVRALTSSGFTGARAVIDVAGDGVSNAGRFVTDARDAAVEAGITINGLAILTDHPMTYTYAHTPPPGGLTQWYRENVIGGPGAFAIEVHDFQSFGEAMARKLLSEIAAVPAHRG